MDEEEKTLAAKLKERKKHVKTYVNSVVNEAKELLGSKVIMLICS